MSLFSAIFTGGSGLQATQKWAEITGRNISNANTPGYHRQDVFMEARLGALGGGVFVSEISRSIDSAVTRSYRYELAKMSQNEVIARGLDEYASLLGQPNDELSIASRLSEFKQSLQRLAGTPGSAATQRTVVMAADSIVYSMKQTTTALQQAANENEMALGHEVEKVNRELERLAELNKNIHRSQSMRADSREMLDERDRIIDSLSRSMNIRTVEWDDGRVTVYTGGGTTLVEGKTAYNISLDKGSGRLYAGDIDITPDPATPGGFEFGRLAGYLELRNEILPTFGKQLDDLARSLIEAFESSDASLGPGQAGLFTDGGNPLDPAKIEGLAGRIAINDAVRPEKGGNLWKVRDGIGATSQQGHSNTVQVEAFLAIFDEVLVYDPGTQMPDMTLEDYANNVVSYQGVVRAEADRSFENSAISAETLYNARASVSGVSIDDELQKMMLIEKSYSANAQLIQTASRMLDQLISIV